MPRAIVRRRTPLSYHDGISYDARLNPQAGGRCVIKVPGSGPRVGVLADFFTFTGGAESRYRGGNGLLIPSAVNTPRIEYDANGNLLGLLIEGARTNIGLWSDDGTNAAWVKSNMTNAKTSTGPDGVANSATRLTASAGNATILQTVTSGSATRAYSVWLKRITGTGTINLTVDNGSTWTAKTITTDWARYDISQAAVTNPVFGIRIVTSGDAVDFYGNQLESAAFPSSYIPTTTGSVARTVDNCSRAYGSEYIKTAGTAYAEVVPSAGTLIDTNGPGIFGHDGNSRHLYIISTPLARIFDGTNFASTDTPVANVINKLSSAFDSNGLAIVRNGGTVGTGSYDGTWGTSGSTIYLGEVGNGFKLFGHIRRLDYWPERKANAELQRLTA